ncbi:acyl-CoA desaturase [Pajaroellobacter abortibovis]|uniref:Stearoyl-CoA desaturase n=1 Tax=Pajaroellobacter abortibovis TaxID=1882918 RepID=A0A1L6MXW8_9BACT|nr:acyl-CoA desaturase [Pajaroellobacter abortibovis]APS00339.1 stearoyl-CoA desaturase [Pajaroellobacter abortibovis]
MRNSSFLHSVSLISCLPFVLVHLIAIVGVWYLGWSWAGLGFAIALYVVRMFGVTAGYHRYFSHRAFRTSRTFQFVLALLAMISSQKGVLWWASHHRTHHKNSDKPGDIHSVLLDGFVWSHVGWILSPKYEETSNFTIPDLMKYPELRWLNRYWAIPPAAFGVTLFLLGGWWALLWGFFVSTTLLWHGTFCINSLTHVIGKKRYQTADNSRNSWILAIITLGEGWHNNHHYYQRSVRQGFFWWEIDICYYVLKGLEAIGLIWDLHTVPAHIRSRNLVSQPVPASSLSSKGVSSLSEQPAIATKLDLT